MRLSELHSETVVKLTKLAEKDVRREDYDRWLKSDLTQQMHLQLEELYYRQCSGEYIDWGHVIEVILNEEPSNVPRKHHVKETEHEV